MTGLGGEEGGLLATLRLIQSYMGEEVLGTFNAKCDEIRTIIIAKLSNPESIADAAERGKYALKHWQM
jgi:hypothetical protein